MFIEISDYVLKERSFLKSSIRRRRSKDNLQHLLTKINRKIVIVLLETICNSNTDNRFNRRIQKIKNTLSPRRRNTLAVKREVIRTNYWFIKKIITPTVLSLDGDDKKVNQ